MQLCYYNKLYYPKYWNLNKSLELDTYSGERNPATLIFASLFGLNIFICSNIHYTYIYTLKCLSIGTPKAMNIPFV